MNTDMALVTHEIVLFLYVHPPVSKTSEQTLPTPSCVDHDVVSVKEVAHEYLTVKLGLKLKEAGFKMPAWNNLVKTSKARELAPYDPEWIL